MTKKDPPKYLKKDQEELSSVKKENIDLLSLLDFNNSVLISPSTLWVYNATSAYRVGYAKITPPSLFQKSLIHFEHLGYMPQPYWELSHIVAPKEPQGLEETGANQAFFYQNLYQKICQLGAEYAFDEIVVLTNDEEFAALDFYGNWPIIGNACVEEDENEASQMLGIISLRERSLPKTIYAS